MAYVVMKSYQNGLKLFVDENASFSDIKNEISDKFTDSKKFFKNSKIAVSFEGKALSDTEERDLVNIMEECGELNVVYVVGKDTETNEMYLKALEHAIQGSDDTAKFGKLYCNSLKKGEHVESETGVVILGDVEPGASIYAKGSIVILGGLYGTAVCNVDKNADKYFVAAMDVSCERLRIGNHKLITNEKAKWLIKPKMQARIAYLKDETVYLEYISSDILKKISENFIV